MKTKLLLLATFIFCIQFLYSQTFHVNEDFNSGSLPAGWNNTAVTGNSAWSFGLDGSIDHGGNNNIDGTRFVYFDDSKLGPGSTNNRSSLETPAFDNSANGATFLEFDYNFRQFGTSVPDAFFVEVFDGSSWNQVFFRDFDDCGNYLSCNSFPRAKIDISSFKNTTCKVRFVYFDGNNWCWYAGMDNIVISSPLTNDVGAQSVLSPESSCGLTANDTVKVRIFNYGANTASGFPVSYIINGGQVVTETVNFSIPVNDSLDYTFTTLANFSAVGTYDIKVFTSYSLDGNILNDSTTIIVENEPSYVPNYFESFELGLGGWKYGGVNSSWAVGSPSGSIINQAASGSNAVVTNLSGSYNNDEVSYLESPCLDFSALTADPNLSFFLNYRTESGIDYLWLEVSVNKGQTWSKVLSGVNATNWYNNTNLNVWTGNSNGWVKVENKLLGFAGSSSVKLRFAFISDNSITNEGFGIDDIQIIEPSQVDIETEALVNPVSNSSCGLSQSQPVTIRVKNNGLTPISTFDAGYRVNSNTAILENGIIPSSPIAPDSFYNHTFSQAASLSVSGQNTFEIWSKVSGDGNTLNDSLSSISVNSNAISLPFFSDFENDNSGSGSNLVTIDTTIDGWVQSNPNNVVTWKMHSGGTNSQNTGPLVDHSTGSGFGNYVYIETSTGNSPNPALLESPCLDLYNLQGAYLSFWYHMHGATIGTLEVEVFDGSSWISVRTITGQQQIAQADPWLEEIVDLSAYVGSSIKVRFSANRTTNWDGDIAIDDIRLFEPLARDVGLLSFLSPTSGCNLAVNSNLTVEVENSGFGIIPPDSVYLFYQIDNLPPVKDTLVDSVSVGDTIIHTFTIGPNLSSQGQTYNLKVWSELNGDSNSVNDTISLAITNYTQSLPFHETFSGFVNQTNNKGWTFSTTTTSQVFFTSATGNTSSGNTGPSSDHAGVGFDRRYIYLESSADDSIPAFFISPCIDLTNSSGAHISFWYHKYGSGMNNLYIDILDGQTGAWVVLDSIVGETHTSPSDPWKKKIINASNYAGQEIKIRYRGYDTFGITGDMAIDLFSIYLPDPFDAKIGKLTSPKSNCGLSSNELICARFENFGSQTINNINFGYTINNGAPIFDSASGISVQPGSEYQFCFNSNTVDLSAPGFYEIKVWTDLQNDVNLNNDTFIVVVSNEIISISGCEDFENSSVDLFVPGANLTGGKFSNNWTSDTIGASWFVASNINSYGPSNDHTQTGPGLYMFIERNSGQPRGEESILTSPCYDLTQISSASFEFWYHQTGNSNKLFVDVFDGQSWSVVDSIIGETHSSSFDPWSLKLINLVDYVGSYVNVRFRVLDEMWYSLDDICMKQTPINQAKMLEITSPVDGECFYSSSEDIEVSFRNIGSNRIDSFQIAIFVDTNVTAAATLFTRYFIDTVWVHANQGANIWNPGDTLQYTFPYKLNMQKHLTYKFDIEMILPGDLDISDNFIDEYKVKHGQPSTVSFYEDFESLTCYESGPLFRNGFFGSNGIYKWRAKCGQNQNGLTGPNRDHTLSNQSGRYLATNSAFGDSTDVALLETMCMDFSSVPNPSLFYWYYMYGSQMGTLCVDINTSGTWIAVDSIIGQQQTSNSSPWLQRSVDLSAYSGTFSKLRFRSKRGTGVTSNMAIDDITILDSTLVSINKLEVVDKFTIYPNPSTGQFNISSNLESKNMFELVVRNMSGQTVFKTKAQNISNYSLDLSNQAKGLYFLQVRTEDNIYSEKLIVQ